MARPEKSIIPLGLPSWIPAEAALLIAQLDQQFRDAVELFGRQGSVGPNRLPEWPGIRQLPNLRGLFAREYEVSSAELEAILTAVRHAESQIQHLIRETFEEVAAAKRRLRAFGRRATLVVGSLQPVDFEHSVLADLALQRLDRLNDDLQRIKTDANDRVTIRALLIEQWIETVRALGPTRSRERQLADHEHRVRRVLELEPRLATGTATVPDALRAAMRSGRGILVGGIHDAEGHRMVAANMNLLTEEGARALLIELPTIYQPVIDDFYAGQDTQADQRRLASRLASIGADRSTVDSAVDAIAAAKSKGLPTVAIDTAIRSTRANRMPESNPFMAGSVEQFMAGMPDEAKVVVLVGQWHTDAIGGLEGILGRDFISVDVNYGYPLGYDISPGHAIISPWDGQHRTPWTSSNAEHVFTHLYNENSTIVVNPR